MMLRLTVQYTTDFHYLCLFFLMNCKAPCLPLGYGEDLLEDHNDVKYLMKRIIQVITIVRALFFNNSNMKTQLTFLSHCFNIPIPLLI